MEKYCINCGKIINQEAEFCKYCGAQQKGKIRVSGATVRSTPVSDGRSAGSNRKTGTQKSSVVRPIVIIILVLAIIAACVVGAIWAKNNFFDQSSNENDQTTEQVQNEATETDNSIETQEPEAVVTDESKTKDANNENNTSTDNDGGFVVGETYTVVADPNLYVRKEPSTNAEILKRKDLVGDDYRQSVGTTGDEDAGLDKGSKVVCLEMSGKWMRIESGWICTENEGITLVK